MADFNEGLLFGIVKDAGNGAPIVGARALLTNVQGDAGLAPVTITGNTSCDTDDNGRFLIGFKWNPLQLVNITAVSENPMCRVSIIGPTPDADHKTVKVYPTLRLSTRMYMAVSLRAVANGGIPDFRKPDSAALTIGKEIAKKLRDYKRFPGVRVMLSSPELYALLGYMEASLSETGAEAPTIAGKWDATIGPWRGVFSFQTDGGCWWADSAFAAQHRGKWTNVASEIQWKFDDAGDNRTFSVRAGQGFVSSYSGTIMPAGQGVFQMTRTAL